MSEAVRKVEEAELAAEERVAKAKADAALIVEQAHARAAEIRSEAAARSRSRADGILNEAKSDNRQKLKENDEYVSRSIAEMEDAVVRKADAAVEAALKSIV